MVGTLPSTDSKKSVLLLVDAMASGGLERQIVELLRGMREGGSLHFHLGVLAHGGERLLEAERLVDTVLPLRRASNASWALVARLPYFFWTIFDEAKKADISIIHSFGCFSDMLGLFIGKILGIQVINGSIRSARPRLTSRDQLSRMCMKYSDRIVANSRAGLRAFHITDDNDKKRVIYNGVDLARFAKIDPLEQTGGFVMCMVANFTRKKDQASLIRIIPSLIKEIESLTVFLIGKGKRLETIRQLISDLHLGHIVKIIDDCDHPEPFIAAADLCLLLTDSSVHGEGISNSILEYMALGKPVIATDGGGNREVVEHGKTGYLVSENTPETLAQYVLEIFHNQEAGKLLGKNGRKKVEEEFALQIMINNYYTLYTE